ncbi:IMP 5'-nucleotidase KNAG_0B03860 [Huiozyma naganishii CBS 8797]|uniref:IMP-specific 5'-nucleotidase 1 n=1 Tax=Huiozyma naganishii (strain ATCC MYA-139 / BCRC 22969 / CBS 8797 / KCTC 17520 / NBRC 10181 / NCYC 3082 / Yp74L-3) TaxID=1071383 RepID=J7RV92_HUIN7|nr:hypothetical protein KNAG_0B03860 [Kazachstania naganishii CBS 8797]CCK68827.1 hypothetical protein KNAG_0B03860 [Kazachstania naganishii CBS 8797]
MSSRYRVEYHLKSHRKDEFIDWIKGLLATPFVLHAVSHDEEDTEDLTTTQRVKSQYAEILKDVEQLILNKIEFDSRNQSNDEEYLNESSLGRSRLNLLVPSIGTFFTPLPLEKAFLWEDSVKAISARRMIAPSFNDVRRLLNTAQIFHFQKQKKLGPTGKPLKMVTFDGDVTLYEDGGSLVGENPVIPYIIKLLACDICVGIVTAAGYDEAGTYEKRLHGLVESVYESKVLTTEQKHRLTIMGGESNYLFRYYETSSELCQDTQLSSTDEDQENMVSEGEGRREGKVFGFKPVDRSEWVLKQMIEWDEADIKATLDFAEKTLNTLKRRLMLPKEAPIMRKKWAVGIVPGKKTDPSTGREYNVRLSREQLEEIVLTLQSTLENFPPARRIQFSCFDGGNDVWCDIGGKNLGIRALQRYYCPGSAIDPAQTLHVGDQFAPMGSANDFKARLAGCTMWIASPEETVDVLNRLTRD